MSWSVSASGAANKVAVQLEQQFANINCSDPGEQTTVQNVRALVAQTLSTIALLENSSTGETNA